VKSAENVYILPWEQGAAGSNPVFPTINFRGLEGNLSPFLFVKIRHDTNCDAKYNFKGSGEIPAPFFLPKSAVGSRIKSIIGKKQFIKIYETRPC